MPEPESVKSGVSDERWWRDVYYTDFSKNEKRTPFEYPSGHQTHWLGQETAAWIYELVRRTKKVLDGAIKLPGYEKWPRFPDLHFHCRIALQDIVENATGHRPIATIPPPRGRKPRDGYSDAFPGYSFDLRSDNAALVAMLIEWIENQRAKHGCQKEKGVKGFASHNRSDLPKSCDWRLVEVLDHRKGVDQALSDAERQRGTTARRIAKKFAGLIVPKIEQFNHELVEVVQALQKKSRPPRGGRGSPVEPIDLEVLVSCLHAIERVSSPAPDTKQTTEDQKSADLMRQLIDAGARKKSAGGAGRPSPAP